MAADTNAGRSIMVFKQDEDKVRSAALRRPAPAPSPAATANPTDPRRHDPHPPHARTPTHPPAAPAAATAAASRAASQIHVLDDSKMLGAVGEPADRASYVEWLKANMKLYALDSGFGMGTHATANYIRSSMAANLRKRMTQANFLLAGVDEDGPGLYFTDYLATMHKMPFACHGHGAAFILSIFDREWKPDLSLEEAKVVMAHCIAELNKRFMIAQPKFTMKIVDKDGVRLLD